MKAALHPAEATRLAALRRYDILDTPLEESYDAVVRLVAAICEAPIAVVNLIDSGRQWFKAEVGLGVRELPLDASICAHAILQPGLFVIPDTQNDPRFRDNPLVTGDPHLRFYAGALLETAEGLPLGTVCVLDYKPRDLTDNQKSLLTLMARQVMAQLELRVALQASADALAEQTLLRREVDHRVQNSLAIVSSLLGMESRRAKSPETQEALRNADGRVMAISSVHRQLNLTGDGRHVNVPQFFEQLRTGLQHSGGGRITVKVAADDKSMDASQAVSLGLIANELVTNAIKYAYPQNQTGVVEIAFKTAGDAWTLTVSDTGAARGVKDSVERSSGLGMKVIRSCAAQLNAMLEIEERPDGTAFILRYAARPESPPNRRFDP